MTDDEKQVIDAAESAVKEAVDRMSAEQSREQVAAIPFLRRMAKENIAQQGNAEDSAVYLFVIQSDPDKDKSDPDVLDPMGLGNSDYAIASELRLLSDFSNLAEAIKVISNPLASICLREADKRSPNALFAYLPRGLCVTYAGGKLTFSRHIAGDEFITHHTSIADDDNPDAFFAKCQATDEEQQFCAAVISLKESAGIMEKATPTAYKLAVQRLEGAAEGLDDKDD